MSKFLTEYRRLRTAGWNANEAYRAAKIAADWNDVGGFTFDGDDRGANVAPGESVHCLGPVRLILEPDESYSLDNLKGDTYNRAVNPDIPESRMAREESEFEERVERDGVWTLVGQYWDGETWQHADSCCGFVGDDWKDSGYDTDIMNTTLTAWRAHKNCPTCGRPKLEESGNAK